MIFFTTALCGVFAFGVTFPTKVTPTLFATLGTEPIFFRYHLAHSSYKHVSCRTIHVGLWDF